MVEVPGLLVSSIWCQRFLYLRLLCVRVWFLANGISDEVVNEEIHFGGFGEDGGAVD